jgi:hypothetical protein
MRAAACLLLLMSLNQYLSAQSHPSGPVKQVMLRDAHLPDQVRKDIYALVLGEMTDGSSAQDAARLQKMAWNLSVSFLKLSKDGSLSILVEGDVDNPLSGMNANGNNPAWLFRRVGDRPVLIFENVGQGVGVGHTFHHGMLDISTAERMGHSMDFSVEVDEFDGTNYRPAYCYDVGVDENGKDKKGPRHPC